MLAHTLGSTVSAQQNAYVAATENAYVKARGADMGEVKWTKGFWKDRFDMVMPNLIPAQYKYFMEFPNITSRFWLMEQMALKDLKVHIGRMATTLNGLKRKSLFMQ